MNFKIIITFFIILGFISCKSTAELKAPKNVILLISDGTGLSQISSAFYYKESIPNYTRFQNIGLINTSSSEQDVTDSAAGATAFACGVKTYNGAIGVDANKKNVKNIVEIVSAKNIKTGVIATSAITHATPASFYAHVFNRGQEEDIALHLTKSEIDFFAGGGLNYFTQRKDGQNLLNTLKNNQFTINTDTLSDFSKIESTQKVAFLLAEKEMPKIEDGRGDFLSKATELGIEFLNKDNSGFFLMSEGSQIDWGGHNNDAPYLISELIDFDNVIGKVLDFAEKDGNTLVVVTSDHETGGFTLAAKKKKREDGSEYSDYSEIGPTFSTGGHSATLIPVFAYGPGSEKFIGVYENNEIFEKILNVTNWDK
ncbi:alkaline phosphatase [Flavivirga sp. 57AJ16]|uniref:alkaline phosphatase n=1 Tax=Flavivirga sp. 57AJ16 TaxID=3025307 RepID=UPI00236541EB|nr:alkaline phosphatase [Flavivirga sp. 57AJ16]MDD7888084.1 alkaline phosphatase [Flavivirga sp. 57AJ16]